MLGQGRSQAMDCVLVFLEHRTVVPQHFLLDLAQVFKLGRRWIAGQHVQDIDTSFCHAGQVISLWRASAIFIFTLCVRLYTSYFTKSFLRQAKPLSFLP
ncbi:hypothetical protein A462_19269 [Pseudomonas sp. Ag1]|nr:hypothetical protein A462_19269 [Pseudomonas sp. Ag1]